RAAGAQTSRASHRRAGLLAPPRRSLWLTAARESFSQPRDGAGSRPLVATNRSPWPSAVTIGSLAAMKALGPRSRGTEGRTGVRVTAPDVNGAMADRRR